MGEISFVTDVEASRERIRNSRREMLQEYNIAYILTKVKYDFQSIAKLVVDQKGEYL